MKLRSLTLIHNISQKAAFMITKLFYRDGHQWARYLKKKKSLHAMGEDCYIDFSVQFEEPYLTRLGDNVWLTDGVVLLNHDGSLSMLNRYVSERQHKFGKIDIGSNVFVGMRSMIMPGISIGDNVVVAAGSIVTKNIEPGKIVGGNPSKVIGTTAQYYQKWKNRQLFTYRDPASKRKELTKYFF